MKWNKWSLLNYLKPQIETINKTIQPRINQPVSKFELILHVSNKITTVCLNYNSVMIQYDSIMHTYMWIYVHN